MWPWDAPARQVAVVGLPGHGKTVFLAGLFWDSFYALATSLSDQQADGQRFIVRAANETASDLFYENAILLERRRLPAPNHRVANPPPAILEYDGIPNRRRWPRRRRLQLHFYDVAGELFAQDQYVRRDVAFLAHADDLIFVFDPTHETFSPPAAAQLINRVFRCAPWLARRNVVVAMTKLDRLQRLCREAVDWSLQYGRSDAEALLDLPSIFDTKPPDAADLPDYLRSMQAISAHVRSWWLHPDRQAQAVLNLLPARARFCAVSALGDVGTTEARDGEVLLTGRPEPYRICDPLLWIFRAAGILS
ncbi:MAG: hypothetical protein IT204_12240 [Fimbriimonadaceae bacterium]|nr:hypothetical protein [Fimbriimonadaceae bacterium]